MGEGADIEQDMKRDFPWGGGNVLHLHLGSG